MLPSLQLLEKVSKGIMLVPNRKKESKRGVHYGLFLLGYKSGLRVSEAVRFDLENKTKRGLYRINKSKGKKERLVYIPKEVVQELKSQNWKPNQTNRHNFYHFLKKVKRELGINQNIELSPHTLRRAFTTYHAESGMPLPLLQKLLGHSSIRTTALYWRSIYGDDDPDDILAGKKWLEKEPPKVPISENSPEPLPKISDSDILRNEPVIAPEKPNNKDNSLLTAKNEKIPSIINYQPQKLIGEISPKRSEKFSLPTKEIFSKREKFSLNNSEQLPVITNREQPNNKEQILLVKIKQLEKELVKVKAENEKLRVENKHLKALVQQDQATETKILQPLPFKIKT